MMDEYGGGGGLQDQAQTFPLVFEAYCGEQFKALSASVSDEPAWPMMSKADEEYGEVLMKYNPDDGK
jgi:hypothetical protein